MKYLTSGVFFLLFILAGSPALNAQTSPNSTPDVPSGPDPDISVVMAIFGGDENYEEATKPVIKLLGKAPYSFAPTVYTLGIKELKGGSAHHLIIVFDLNGHRHVFSDPYHRDIDAKALRAEAKLEDAAGTVVDAPAISDNPATGSNITVVEAVYGYNTYVDVTKSVTQLLAKPDGFEPTGYALGVNDPNHGEANYLIIVFDLDGHRHFFVRQNNGDNVDAKALEAKAKLDDAAAPPK
jgi:hypothetical protein